MMGGTASAGVAIVGIACRFPGAADHSAFWRNLCEGAESISALSDEDLLSARVPAELLRDPSYVSPIRCFLLRIFARGSAAHGSTAAAASGRRGAVRCVG